MFQHLSYLKYVLRHKYYVFKFGAKVNASLWRCLIHDWSKFRLFTEWLPYANQFYNKDGSHKDYKSNEQFDLAWLSHQKLNKHHHQYWTLLNDDSSIETFEMPEIYVREMIVDWMSAGFVITGKDDAFGWYVKNKTKMRLHQNTRLLVEQILTNYYQQ